MEIERPMAFGSVTLSGHVSMRGNAQPGSISCRDLSGTAGLPPLDALEDMRKEETIRRHAYQLWQEAGCPDGRDNEFWEKARELAAIEENQSSATEPRRGHDGPWGQLVEPAEAITNQGDFPGMADQGDEQPGVPSPKPRS